MSAREVNLGLPVPHEEQEAATSPKWEMKEIKPWHKQMCSMLAQGIDRATIAQVLDCTPEYVSMLAKQPLIQQYVQDFSTYAGLQLEAQFTKAVSAIGETLENGSYKEKIAAARLQMEATRRIGAKGAPVTELIDTNSRLAKLAERLLALQAPQPKLIATAEVIYENQENAQDAQGQQRSHQSAQEDGDGYVDPTGQEEE